MKHENKRKRKGKKVLPTLEVKNPWRNLKENDKKFCFEPWLIEEREKELFEKVWIVTNTWKTYVFKKLSERFSIDQKLDSIDRKLHLINPTAIKRWLNQADSNQNFNRNFDRSRNRFNRLKIWKNQFFFLKIEQFYAETSQSIVFYE